MVYIAVGNGILGLLLGYIIGRLNNRKRIAELKDDIVLTEKAATSIGFRSGWDAACSDPTTVKTNYERIFKPNKS